VVQFKDGEVWGNFVIDGNRLYALHPTANKLKVVDISVPSSPVVRDSLPLGGGYTEIRKCGSYLYVFSPETLEVLDASTLDSVVHVASMQVPVTYLPKNRFYDVSRYGDYLAAGTQEGLYVYDVTNAAFPVLWGKYLAGYPHVSTYLNARRLISVQWDMTNPGIPERLEGFLIFEPSFTGVEDPGEAIPASSVLEQNYPNPFNPTTTIGYTVGVVSRQSLVVSNVRLAVYDLLGREVKVLVDENQAPGNYQVRFDGTRLSSGVYFFRLTVGNHTETKQMMLLR
jgi:hypothetical protein